MKVHKIAKPVRFKPVSSFTNPPKDSVLFFCAFKFMSQKNFGQFYVEFQRKENRICKTLSDFFISLLFRLLSMDKKSENK